MSCWLCESSDEPIVSNKTPIKHMLTTLYPKLVHRMPAALDLCSGCFLELNTYYNFKQSYNMDLKTEDSEDEEDFVDLTDDSNGKRACIVCSKSIQKEDVCYVKECSKDDDEGSVLSADLIRAYFPQIKLDTSDNPLACARCSDLLKGMHDYRHKFTVKTASAFSDDLKNDRATSEDQDYESNSALKLASTGSGSSTHYETASSSMSMIDETSVDSDLQFDDDVKPFGEHFLLQTHPSPHQNHPSPDQDHPPSDQDPKPDDQIPTSISQQIAMAQNNCDTFLSLKTPKGRVFQCERCEYTSNRKDNMRRHIFIRHIRSSMMRKCPHCPLQTVSADILSKHVEQKHSNIASTRVFMCPMCKFKTRNYASLQNHMKFPHYTNENSAAADKFKCAQCNFKTNREQYLQKHMRYNHSDLMMYANCPLCDYKTRRKDNLKQHMDHVHRWRAPGTDCFKCHMCAFQCSRKEKLKTHFDDEHADNDAEKAGSCLRCGVCSYSCRRKEDLKRHVEQRHLRKEVVFRCKLCPYSADIFDYLQMHIKYAHGKEDKLYRCRVCAYNTTKRILFGQHCRRRHGCAPPPDECGCDVGGGGEGCDGKCRGKVKETEVICLDDEAEMVCDAGRGFRGAS